MSRKSKVGLKANGHIKPRLSNSAKIVLAVTVPVLLLFTGAFIFFHVTGIGDVFASARSNSQSGQWGTDHDPLKDLISVPMKVETSKNSVEQVTITLVKTAKGGEIRCTWGTQVLVAEFSNKA